MRKPRWKENEIEDMLHQLPKVKDKRTKDEVFAGIHNKKRKKQWFPLIVGVASLFLMVVLASSLIIGKEGTTSKEESSDNGKLAVSELKRLPDHEQQDTKVKDKSAEDKEENSKLQSMREEDIETKEEVFDSESVKKDKVVALAPAIYPDDLKNKSPITMGVPDNQQNFVIPISIVVNRYDESDTLNQLVNQMSDINEEQYGLSDYFPLDIEITQGTEMNTAHIELHEDSQLLDEDILFLHTMEETLSYLNIEKMTFATDGKQGARFAHAGFLKEADIPQQKNRTFLLYQNDESSPKFLVPSNIDYQDFEEALQAGKEEPDIEGISSAIPDDLIWEKISSDGDLVTIQLAEQVVIENSEDSLQALEAILFIAKEFGFNRVKFENAPIEKVGNLNLTEDIVVPKAPNQVN
ncbi:hypothetical protein AKG34_15040 [Peribacillus butanolivorans]|uniref:hypothetical protein n=1 Tax=Peribacillus butanolivorans TaxID=421767 RepID=UPI0006A755BD|nr:hypothetical protein [Peribacillus butanolivorans]KON69928.1 hypothetical protein AKG34_15040 [Peribacillus butanolivorans]